MAEIALTANIRNLRKEIVGKRDRTTASLNALSNKDGLFAFEHRAMIRLYADILDRIDVHMRRATEADAAPRDARSEPILF